MHHGQKANSSPNLSNLPVSEQSSALPHITLPTAFYFLWSEKESTTGTTFQFRATLVFLIIFMRFEFFSDSNWMELVASANQIFPRFCRLSARSPHLNHISAASLHLLSIPLSLLHGAITLFGSNSARISVAQMNIQETKQNTHTQRISRILDFNLPILKRNVFHLSLDCTKELIRSPYLASCQGSSRPRRTCNNRPVGSGRSFPI